MGSMPHAVANASAEDRETIATIVSDSKKGALRYVALLPVLMLVIYLGLILFFRARGGYAPVILSRTET